jgi:YkoY family integral membrane protein
MLRAVRQPMFGQTFQPHDIAVIALLVVLEGVLSIDNALVLGLLAKRLPKDQQKKALTYGLVGAFVFRFIAIATATFLLKWTIFKLLGGGYLIWVAVKYFFFESHDEEHKPHIEFDAEGKQVIVGPAGAAPPRPLLPFKRHAGFWPTVFVIEMTDIAFAVDSIVAAIGIVGQTPANHPEGASHPKMWVIILGGFLGVVLMRFAAVLFIKLLDRFPRFETAAYLLVIVIGLKLCVDWFGNSAEHPHRIDFHHPGTAAFWAFWVAMLASFAVGFIPRRKPHGFDVVHTEPKG